MSWRHAAAVVPNSSAVARPLRNGRREATTTGSHPPNSPFDPAPVRFIERKFRGIGKDRRASNCSRLLAAHDDPTRWLRMMGRVRVEGEGSDAMLRRQRSRRSRGHCGWRKGLTHRSRATRRYSFPERKCGLFEIVARCICPEPVALGRQLRETGRPRPGCFAVRVAHPTLIPSGEPDRPGAATATRLRRGGGSG
jgi:hypothetical protein